MATTLHSRNFDRINLVIIVIHLCLLIKILQYMELPAKVSVKRIEDVLHSKHASSTVVPKHFYQLE
jgi:hypothetical protein